MASRIVELKWNCGECDTAGIKGRHKQCPSCGAPREKGEMRMDGIGSTAPGGYNPAASVVDPALLELATAGKDWFCTHCDSGNRGDVETCGVCGAPRYHKTAEELDLVAQSVDVGDGETDDEFDAKLYARTQRKRAFGVVASGLLGTAFLVFLCTGF